MSFSEFHGLSSAEVKEKTNQGLTNDVISRPTRTYAQIFFANVFNFYTIILFAAMALLLILHGSKDIYLSGALLLLNILAGLIQELRAKWALDKLATVTTKTATVRRDGKSISIPISEVVEGDTIELKPGDQVVVDGHILASDSVEIDESSLTGESEFVPKQTGEKVLSGSFCVAGFGLLRAEKVGQKSYINNFTQKARSYQHLRTPIEKRLRVLFRMLLVMLVILGPLTVIAGVNVDLSLKESIENFVNLLISLLPQGLIASVTLLYAYGAIRISRLQTLIQRINAIGEMGHVSVVCCDKTGTLTKNQLAVVSLIPTGEISETELQKNVSQFVSSLSYANQTVQALQHFLQNENKTYTPGQLTKVAEVPFRSQNKWSGVSLSDGQTLLMGAPELFVHDEDDIKKTKGFQKKGLRVLAFARSSEPLVSNQKELPTTYQFIGFAALKDELRDDVAETLAAFHQEKIKIKIISGDNAETVKEVARQTGVESTGIIIQSELEKMDKSDFEHAVKKYTLFARISPDMKAKIISALIKQGLHVAMVGDGVNDVPALKQAKVAVAMNAGTQIAKDVSDIILLQNSFAVLPKAIAEGREITQKIYAIAKVFFVKVVYLAVLFFLSGFANAPFPVSLAQTTWLGLMMTGIPTLLIALNILKPAYTKTVYKDLLNYCLATGVIGGLLMLILSLIMNVGFQEDLIVGRTVVTIFACLYNTLILWDIHGISLLRPATYRKNLVAFFIVGAIGTFSLLFPYYVFMRMPLFSSLDPIYWIIVIIAFLVSVMMFTFGVHTLSWKKISQILFRDV